MASEILGFSCKAEPAFAKGVFVVFFFPPAFNLNSRWCEGIKGGQLIAQQLVATAYCMEGSA